ncbi:25998_t:CDS:2, partial [Gigaspora rosea]
LKAFSKLVIQMVEHISGSSMNWFDRLYDLPVSTMFGIAASLLALLMFCCFCVALIFLSLLLCDGVWLRL